MASAPPAVPDVRPRGRHALVTDKREWLQIFGYPGDRARGDFHRLNLGVERYGRCLGKGIAVEKIPGALRHRAVPRAAADVDRPRFGPGEVWTMDFTRIMSTKTFEG